MAMPRTLHRVVAVAGATAIAATLTIGAAIAPAGAASKDAQLAEEGVIVASDVPATWDSTPPDDSGDKALDKIAKSISGCKAYLAAKKTNDKAPNAESRDFTSGDEDLSNKVWVFPTEKAAKKAFAGMADETNADCIQDVFEEALDQQLGSDPSIADVRVAIVQTDDLPSLGDDIIGYTGGAEFTATDGSTERLLLVNVIIRVGRSLISYSISGPPAASGFSTSFNAAIDSAIGATITRMEDAL